MKLANSIELIYLEDKKMLSLALSKMKVTVTYIINITSQ